LHSQIISKLGLNQVTPDVDDWRDILHRLRNPKTEISIAVVGKYAEHKDAYKSIYEAIDHAGIKHQAQIRIGRIQSEEIEREGPERLLAGYDGILVPGGFGERGVEGKVEAIRWARERKIPFLGICLGMQCAVIEFARNVVGLENANSSEFDKDSRHPVICLLDEQRNVTDKGGTMRLGAQDSTVRTDTKTFKCYESDLIYERHRHRYEFNNQYRQQMEANGLVIAATSKEDSLVEVVEVKDHPWFVAVQYHPEFKSKPTKSHPLFAGFVEAATKKKLNQSAKSNRPRFIPSSETAES
jgi:CTP synthase